MKVKSIFITFTILICFLFCSEVIRACSCSESLPPCGGINKSQNIFLGEATNVTVSNNGKKVEFKVVEAFNNVKTQTLTVFTGLGGGDCGFPFKKGEKYLVYGNSSEGTIYAGICSRTRELLYAQDDLEVLRAIKSKKSIPTRLFGNVILVKKEKDYDENPLLGVKLKVIDEKGKFYETVTDSFGSYRFVDLPVGKYQLLATYKDNFTKKEVIIINARNGEQCLENNFFFEVGGRITGKVIDKEGNPVAGIRVTLEKSVTPNSQEKPFWIHNDESGKYEVESWAYTNEFGEYELEGLKSGKYILGVNHIDPISKEYPFPPTTLENESPALQSKPINVIESESLDGINIQFSSSVKSKLITGVILLPNGKPATEAKIRIDEERTNRQIDSVGVDKEGRFALKIFEGQSYYLYVFKDSDSFWSLDKEIKKVFIGKNEIPEPYKFIVPNPSKKK